MGRKGNKAKAKSASAREAQNRRAETSANAPQNVRRPNEHGGSSTEQVSCNRVKHFAWAKKGRSFGA